MIIFQKKLLKHNFSTKIIMFEACSIIFRLFKVEISRILPPRVYFWTLGHFYFENERIDFLVALINEDFLENISP